MKQLAIGILALLIHTTAAAQMKIHGNGRAMFALDPSESPKGQVHIKSKNNERAQSLYIDGPKSTTAFTSTFASLYLGNSDQTNNNYARLNFGDGDDGATATIGSQIEDHAANSGTLEFWTRKSGEGIKQRMTILSNGRVNIGGGATDYLFSVNGDASKIGGGSWKVPSDSRLKKAITPFTDGLSQVMKINPVNFQYNGLGGIADTNTNFVGILAQEMQGIAPYTVTKSSSGEYLEFDSNAVIYMLINAVKEQQEQIQRLEMLLTE